jgi:hypothetical protein
MALFTPLKKQPNVLNGFRKHCLYPTIPYCSVGKAYFKLVVDPLPWSTAAVPTQ